MRRFYFLLIVILVGIISLYVIPKQGRGKESFQENIMPASSYEISGNRSGQVTVKDKVTGQVIRTFQMQEAVVRETFILDDGQTVGASQKDHTVFWDLDTGREIRRFDERIYGFSHDESKFFTFRQGILVYNYPEMTLACELAQGITIGPEKFLFSPNDRFLAIGFVSGRPASDEYYPKADPRRRRIRAGKLFNLKTCQEIQEIREFPELQYFIGKFSEDSKFYYLEKIVVYRDYDVKKIWRFDLTTYQLQKIAEENVDRK